MKRIVSIFVTLIVLFSIVFPINFVQAINEERESELNSNNNLIEENYSEAYRKYLELPEKEKEQVKIVPNKYDISLAELYKNEERYNEVESFGIVDLSLQEATIPSRFNLKDKINIRVESQGSDGNCWAFASTKSLETNLLLHGYGEYDLSEKHLVYLESDEFANTESNVKLATGGYWGGFEDYVYNGYGPVFEEEVPYNNKYTVKDYEYLLNLEPKVYVNETVNFPTIYKAGRTYSDEELRKFREKVKTHIMKNGSIYAYVMSMASLPQYYNQETSSAYISKYDDSLLKYSHAVSIIGWDDNYSRNNFNAKNRPQKDGAYIALNSWGTSFGQNGIYYISYEDIFVEQAMAGVVSATNNKEEAWGEIVEFKDANLYNAFKNLINKKLISYDDEKLTLKINTKVINSIKEINFSNMNIEDLTGIEKFTQLKDINLQNNKITNMDLLTKLPKKYTINLENNKITKIPDFFNISMKEINLKNNEIQDISNLSHLQYLYEIDLSNNPIKEGLKNLEITKGVVIIKLNNCNLIDDDLKYLKNLKLNNLHNKIYIELRENNLNNIQELNNVEGIYSIDLSGNKNINTLTIPNVKELYLRNCNLTNINLLFNLDILDLSENKNINISNIPKTKNLYLENCNLETLNNMSQIPTEGLFLKNNPITDEGIKILKKSNIKSLDLSKTKIIDVATLGSLVALEFIDLSDNKNIKNINKLMQIKKLILKNCGLESYKNLLDLKKVEEINLSNNNIKEIYKENIIKNNIRIILDNNNISYCEDLPSNIISIKNQIIDTTYENKKNIEEEIMEIFQKKYKENIEINFNNCTIDYENKKINIIDEEQKIATINIKGGKYDGLIYNIDLSQKVDEEEKEEKEESTILHYININNKKYITEINLENNTVSNILATDSFKNIKTRAKNKEGKILEKADKLGTGSTIEILDDNGNVVDTYIISIKGDLNGDGKLSLSDISRAELGYIGNIDLEDEYLMASDVNGDGKFSLSDISRMSLVLIGLAEI